MRLHTHDQHLRVKAQISDKLEESFCSSLGSRRLHVRVVRETDGGLGAERGCIAIPWRIECWSLRELSFTTFLSSVQVGQSATPTLNWYAIQ